MTRLLLVMLVALLALPVHAQDYLAPYRCASADGCEVLLVIKWLGVNATRYQMYCPMRDMGFDAATAGTPAAFDACRTLARQFVKEGVEFPVPFHFNGGEGQGFGAVVYRIHSASCLWVRDVETLHETLEGGTADAGFFFQALP